MVAAWLFPICRRLSYKIDGLCSILIVTTRVLLQSRCARADHGYSLLDGRYASPNGVRGWLFSVIIGKDTQIRHTVVGNGYIGVPPTAFPVQPSFDFATAERNWTRTYGVARAVIIVRSEGPPQVICSADYERADCRILDYRMCLTGAIAERL
jgi:hypothetical protein